MTINLGRPATTPCPSGETTIYIIHSTFTPLPNPLHLWSADLCQFVSTPFKSEQNPEPLLKLQTIGSQIIRNHFAKKKTFTLVASYLPHICLYWPHICQVMALCTGLYLLLALTERLLVSAVDTEKKE